MAFAERACVLAFVAHFASPFWVGHFDFCTVLRVWECIADIRFLINFKAGHAKTANYITRCSNNGRTRSAILNRDDALSASIGFFACGACVFETHVLSSAGRVAIDALQTLLVVLRGTKRDRSSRAKRAVGGEVVFCNHFDPGRTLDLTAVVYG